MSPIRKRTTAREDKLQALLQLPPDAGRAAQNEAIASGLSDAQFRVVARAATLAGERAMQERIPDLLAAWARFLQDGVKRDPQCLAKSAITGALLALECPDVSFWLEAMHYRQLEPVWGGTTDTAVNVRRNCAMGLINTGHARAIIEVTTLLNDPERDVRAGAAKAISCGDPLAAEAVLRFKVLAGDREAEVLGECFTGLLAIAPEHSLQLVSSQLRHSDDAVRDFAALALGESRLAQALDHLIAAWNDAYLSPAMRSVIARAVALIRTEAAFDWLVGLIEKGRPVDADIAADALSVYDRNARLMQRVREAKDLRRRAQATATR